MREVHAVDECRRGRRNNTVMKWAAVVVFLLVSSTSVAQAEGAPPIDVVSGGCVDASTIEAAVREALEAPALPPGFSARVVETDGKAVVEFRHGGMPQGHRVINPGPAGCSALNQAIAVAIAVAADTYAVLTPLDPPPKSAGARSEPALEPPPQPLPSAFAPPPVAVDAGEKGPPRKRAGQRDALRVGASLEIGGGIGLTPEVNAATSAMLELAYGEIAPSGVIPELSARAGVFGALPTEQALYDAPVTLGVMAGRLDLCVAAAASRFRVRGCASGLAGALLTDGADDAAWCRAGGRLDGLWMIVPEVGLTGSFDALANLAPSYVERSSSDGVLVLSELGPAALVASSGAFFPWW
jgi:hypothetical protein